MVRGQKSRFDSGDPSATEFDHSLRRMQQLDKAGRQKVVVLKTIEGYSQQTASRHLAGDRNICNNIVPDGRLLRITLCTTQALEAFLASIAAGATSAVAAFFDRAHLPLSFDLTKNFLDVGDFRHPSVDVRRLNGR